MTPSTTHGFHVNELLLNKVAEKFVTRCSNHYIMQTTYCKNSFKKSKKDGLIRTFTTFYKKLSVKFVFPLFTKSLKLNTKITS